MLYPKTGTVYVPVQSGHVVDVINAAECNATVKSGCSVEATASVGSGPLAAAIDEATDTIYVLNGNDGTVSVVDGARCNAWVIQGCGRPLATIKVGQLPVAAAFNPATRTVYVANLNGGSVSVIDAARDAGPPADAGGPPGVMAAPARRDRRRLATRYGLRRQR